MAELLSIEKRFLEVCDAAGIHEKDKAALLNFLIPMKEKSADTHEHYLHMLRVSLLARDIGNFLHHEERPLLMAGALHDCGKFQILPDVLGKKSGWNEKDAAHVRTHVLDGYRMLRGRFDFSAEIMVLHHRFQPDGYPKQIPKPLRAHSETTKLLIQEYARIIALADVYDALHRTDNTDLHLEALSGKDIRERMLKWNEDRRKLIGALYDAGILRE